VQYFTHLPVILVGFHMLGATLVWIATLAMLHSLRTRPVLEARTGGPAEVPAQPEPVAVRH
jgi:cytochrome c oxidase assembly protein subunit 15